MPASFIFAFLAAVRARFCWREPIGDLVEAAGPLVTSLLECLGGFDLPRALLVPFFADAFERLTRKEVASTFPSSFSRSAKARAFGFSGFLGAVVALLRTCFKARPSRPEPLAEALRCVPRPLPGVPIGARLRRFRFFF